MPTASYPAPARTVKPLNVKPETIKPSSVKPPVLPEGLELKIYDDGSAFCQSRTTPGTFYNLSFFALASGPVVTDCDCPATGGCWHKRALLTRLKAPAASLCPEALWVVGQCPGCGGDLVHQSEYRGGRGYQMVTRCWGTEAAGTWPAVCDYSQEAS